MKQITSFQGEYRWLSNFWLVDVKLDGYVYPSVEHAYVAAKTLDKDARLQIWKTEKPGQVKRFGRTLVLRADWDQVKLPTMEWLLRQKFQNDYLRFQLAATRGIELIEGNTWGDTFWGVCRGVGENHLGKLLMQIREDL